MRTILILLVVLVLAACGGSERDRTVVAAFYPLAFAAERLAPDAVEVRNLTPPGVEPHDVELSAKDVRVVADAELVIYAGAGFQPALERSVASTGAAAVDVLDGIRLRRGAERHDDEPEEEHEARDPHVWLDPLLYADVVERIAAALDPPADADTLVAELQRLDAQFRSGLRDCERRELVTSHAAYGYLAARYELAQIALTGLSPEAEPPPQALRALVDEVREHGATTVFVEPLVSPRLAETVAREAGVTTRVLDPLEGLTNAQLDRGENYFTIMRSNLAALREALSCR